MPPQAKWPPLDPTTAPQHVQGCGPKASGMERQAVQLLPRFWASCEGAMVGRILLASADLEDMLDEVDAKPPAQ